MGGNANVPSDRSTKLSTQSRKIVEQLWWKRRWCCRLFKQLGCYGNRIRVRGIHVGFHGGRHYPVLAPARTHRRKARHGPSECDLWSEDAQPRTGRKVFVYNTQEFETDFATQNVPLDIMCAPTGRG